MSHSVLSVAFILSFLLAKVFAQPVNGSCSGLNCSANVALLACGVAIVVLLPLGFFVVLRIRNRNEETELKDAEQRLQVAERTRDVGQPGCKGHQLEIFWHAESNSIAFGHSVLKWSMKQVSNNANAHKWQFFNVLTNTTFSCPIDASVIRPHRSHTVSVRTAVKPDNDLTKVFVRNGPSSRPSPAKGPSKFDSRQGKISSEGPEGWGGLSFEARIGTLRRFAARKSTDLLLEALKSQEKRLWLSTKRKMKRGMILPSLVLTWTLMPAALSASWLIDRAVAMIAAINSGNINGRFPLKMSCPDFRSEMKKYDINSFQEPKIRPNQLQDICRSIGRLLYGMSNPGVNPGAVLLLSSRITSKGTSL
ncbi:hypothetical protein C8J56DRAFT_882107 [Mycena floridula]|nr:hypothetical protein C8J56DRAFT_882107 [Mycena floridula]